MPHHTADLAVLPLPQLLELLHQHNVRYAPNASREELEELLQSRPRSRPRSGGDRSRRRASTRQASGDTDRTKMSNGVVDTVVVPVDIDDTRIYQYAKRREQSSRYISLQKTKKKSR